MNDTTSLYIHIPFCRNLCYYCDFNKILLTGQPIADYVAALVKEIDLIKKETNFSKLETIYFGGGTPSILSSDQLRQIFQAINQNFQIIKTAEISIEANPEDINEEKVNSWLDLGINRVSMGVQSFSDSLLEKIGRKHRSLDVFQAISRLKACGLKNISLDLMYSLPDQDLAMLEQTLDLAISLDLPHYSLYSLMMEDHTLFACFLREKKLNLPNDELSLTMMKLVIEKMNAAGFVQYEISNFARDGFVSRHNLVYWNNEHYLGVGAGASGYYRNLRYKNHGPIKHYLKRIACDQLPHVTQDYLTKENQIEEELFLGLRKKSGINKDYFSKKFNRDFTDIYGAVAQKLVQKGLLIVTPNQVRLSKKGLFLANDVFAEFIFS